MEVAIFSEGDADEASLRVLVDAVLGVSTRPTVVPYRRRGWPGVAEQLPTVVRSIYFKTNAVGLVVVADGNGSPLDPKEPTNRLVRLREIAARCQPRGRTDRPALRIAVGIAYPSIEAWWLASEHGDVSESVWARRTSVSTYSKQDLKRRLYGSEFSGTPHMTECMKRGAEQAAARLSEITKRFPFGFGTLVCELGTWR